MSFFRELTRRNVHKVGVGYLAVGWLVTEVLSTALPAFEAPAWVAKTVLVLFLLGFPFALWLSWAFEITVDGIKRTEQVEPGESLTDVTGRKIDFAIIGILALALILVVVDNYVLEDDARVAEIADVSQIDSIAVLPFEDFSAGGDQGHLAVGLSDSILHMLAQVEGLKVAARTSSFSFRGKDVGVATIGSELGVGAVLEGSVQRSGDTLRIIAQLVRTSDQSHLWSGTFDRPAGDIFAVQDEIAGEIVKLLQPESNAGSAAKTSVEVFELVARADQHWQRRTAEGTEAAIAEYEQAVALDPDYAPAQAGLAMAYLFNTYYGAGDTDEVKLLVERAIDRALALDPDNAMAWGARGMLARDLDEDEAAEDALRRAIELNPNEPYFYIWLAGVDGTDRERLEENLALIRKAYELDPRNAYVVGRYASMLMDFGGDPERALVLLRQVAALEPESPRPYTDMAQLHSTVGRYDDAVRAALAAIQRAPDSPSPYVGIASYLLMLEDETAAEEWMAKARARNPNVEYWYYWFTRPERLDEGIGFARAQVVKGEASIESRDVLVRALWYAGQDEAALELALEVLTGEDGELHPGFDRFSSMQATMWLLPPEDPRHQQVFQWFTGLIDAFASQGFVNSGIWQGRAFHALVRDEHAEAIEHLEEAYARGARDLRQLRHFPPYQALADESAYQDLVARIEADIRRQRNALRAEGI